MLNESVTYAETLCVFRDLLEDENLAQGLSNEYVRGGVNLIADLFAVRELDVGSRMDDVLADLRRIPAFADPRNGLKDYGVIYDPMGESNRGPGGTLNPDWQGDRPRFKLYVREHNPDDSEPEWRYTLDLVDYKWRDDDGLPIMSHPHGDSWAAAFACAGSFIERALASSTCIFY